MAIVHDHASMLYFVEKAVQVAGENPVLIDTYLQEAIEVDVDAICDDDEHVYIAGVMEHIEEAGVHSGDSACSLPPWSLTPEIIAQIEQQTVKLARALGVRGLMNVQFAVKDSEIFILEVNPRASRTVPFVAKATGVPVAKIASKVMAGSRLRDFGLGERADAMPYVAVKEAVFPFNRFPGVDIILGPEMRSTGEAMGIDRDFGLAFAKSQLGAGVILPFEGRAFISVRDRDKPKIVEAVRILAALGFQLVATRGTAAYLNTAGIETIPVNKVMEGPPHIVELMMDGEIALVFNTTEGAQSIRDSFSLRRTALVNQIPYFTTVAGSVAAVQAIEALQAGELTVASLQDYAAGTATG
jgi:carbamoyl-phosphate synthase large subunit